MRLMSVLFILLSSLWGLAQEPNELSNGEEVQQACTLSVEIRDVVGPATYDYLQRAEKIAKEKNCASIFVRINTPGGNLQSTRLIVEQIMSSNLPYLCLITPSGGHAGSAGAIIMQACHINGGMEATNIGAASPVSGSGQEIPEDLRKKLFEDTKSWVEGIAKYRGRSVEFAKDIVVDAKALDAREALKQNAIDVVVASQEEFLEFAKGKPVKVTGDKKVDVHVGDLEIFAPGLRHDIMQIFSNPQWAYLIFMGSLGLLYFELTHPGAMVPGVVGAIGVVISLMNFHMLDVSWGAVFLIILGLGFMFAEFFVPSFGALGLGGIASFIMGSLFLFDGKQMGHELPIGVILATSLVLGAFTLALSYFAIQAMKSGQEKRKKEDWVGHQVEVREFDEVTKKGMVFHNGELWKCHSNDILQVGDVAKIKRVSGLTLEVRKL